MGLNIEDNGFIKIDRDTLTTSVTAENTSQSFLALNSFKDILKEKANHASIDPMAYVNKITIAYKNPGHNFVAPYVSSIYSGMMLDRYC